MNIQKIAEFLLERRHRASPVVLNGEIIEAIESEGLQEALLRRWLVPDMDTGNLQITSSPAHVAEMEELAKDTYRGEVTQESGAAQLAIGHSQRRLVQEIAAPGTGKPAPSMTPSSATPTTAAPAPPPTPTTAPIRATAAPPVEAENEMQVGDEVVVEEGRRAYRGKVSARTPDGNYRVSFGPERPARASREYKPNEIRLTPSAPV